MQGHALAQASLELHVRQRRRRSEGRRSKPPVGTASAAEQGSAAAQYSFGDRYFNGEGVPQDDDEAASLVPPRRSARIHQFAVKTSG